MTTLTALALALFGSALAGTDAVDQAAPELASSPAQPDGTVARTPSRPTSSARPSSGGSRPSTASRPSSGSRPSTASRPSSGSRPSTASRPSSAPSRPSTVRPSAAPPRPSAAPPRAPSTRPGTPTRPPVATRPGTPTRPPVATRPGVPARPGAVRPGTPVRPPVAHSPARPGYAAHAPARAYGGPRVRYAPGRYYVRPYSGVFVYGPRPVYHSMYYYGGSRPSGAVQVRERHMPERAVDRDNSFALGLRGGSYFGGYQGANVFADAGLGLVGRYRPTESVGLELAGSRYFDDERAHTSGSASVNLFAFPWTRVSPYVLAGGTFTDRNVSDSVWRDEQVQTIVTGAPLMGAHAGLGMEFAIGKHLAIDVEARAIGYLNGIEGDPTAPVAFQTGIGALWHF